MVPIKSAAAADTLIVAGAATYGTVTWLAEVDILISIITGILVSISVCLSIYIHLRRLWRDDEEDKDI